MSRSCPVLLCTITERWVPCFEWRAAVHRRACLTAAGERRDPLRLAPSTEPPRFSAYGLQLTGDPRGSRTPHLPKGPSIGTPKATGPTIAACPRNIACRPRQCIPSPSIKHLAVVRRPLRSRQIASSTFNCCPSALLKQLESEQAASRHRPSSSPPPSNAPTLRIRLSTPQLPPSSARLSSTLTTRLLVPRGLSSPRYRARSTHT